jgi:hypothetical protein
MTSDLGDDKRRGDDKRGLRTRVSSPETQPPHPAHQPATGGSGKATGKAHGAVEQQSKRSARLHRTTMAGCHEHAGPPPRNDRPNHPRAPSEFRSGQPVYRPASRQPRPALRGQRIGCPEHRSGPREGSPAGRDSRHRRRHSAAGRGDRRHECAQSPSPRRFSTAVFRFSSRVHAFFLAENRVSTPEKTQNLCGTRCSRRKNRKTQRKNRNTHRKPPFSRREVAVTHWKKP